MSQQYNEVALSQYKENIRYWESLGNDYERTVGRKWYDVEHDNLKIVADKLHIDLRTFAAVISALSPRLAWVHNVNAAEKVVRYHQNGTPLSEVKTHGFPMSKAKAYALLDGADPETILKGNKTNAFYHNLMRDEGEYVTVDSHAVGVAFNVRLVGVSPTTAQYRVIAQAYREVAAELGIKGEELQAQVWVTYRRYFVEPVEK